MRRFDKKNNIQKVNLIVEQRYLESKGLIKEDRGTERNNSQRVIDDMKTKSNEELKSYPVKIYSGWALDIIDNPNSVEEKYRETAERMVNEPKVVSQVTGIKPVIGMTVDSLKRAEYGPSVEFKAGPGTPYSIEVTREGVKNYLLGTNDDGSPKDFIEQDGFNTLYSIMKRAVDASSDYTDNEKSNLLYYLSVHLRKFVKK